MKLILGLVFATAALAQSPATLEAVVATDAGTFRFEFAPDNAPKHVDQFLRLARQSYYDGSAFFRVVPGGVIQGGDPLLKNSKTPKKLWGTGGLNLLASEYGPMKHERGVVSTVRIPDKPNSDGAQFFVCVSAQPALDGQYSAFGRVTEGMEVVDKISQKPASLTGVADKLVRILKITIEAKKSAPFADTPVSGLHKVVTFETTLGQVKIQMMPEWAPEHVRNFLNLASTGWYNGTAFHRVIKGFMAQGGMSDTKLNTSAHPGDRWVHTLKGEFRNDVKHTRGMVSMARTDDPDSARTSFFLMLADSPHLDGKYSIFGRMVSGMEVLEAFEKEQIDGEAPHRRIEITATSVGPE